MPNADYLKSRIALIPDAEALANKETMSQFVENSSDAARWLWSRLFHLWMDRLCYERIYKREWPR